MIIALAGCLLRGLLDPDAAPTEIPEDALHRALPGTARFEKIDNPIFHYEGFDGTDAPTGIVLATDTVPPAVRGYLGQVGAALGLTPTGQITGVIPFRHGETPYYMDMVTGSGLVDTMAGVEVSKPFPELDAVSGATVSSMALIRDVRETAARGARTILGIEVPPPLVAERNPWTDWKVLLLGSVLLAALAAGFFGKKRKLAAAVSLVNLAVVGFVLNTPLTLSSLARLLTLDLPGFGNPLLLLVLLFTAVSIPLQGRTYCRLVCPFGYLQQLANSLSPWNFRVSSRTASILPQLRRILLGALLVLGIWAGWSGFTEVEPFFGLFSLKLTAILWVVVIFIFGVSFFWRRFWCNALCPTGTVLAMASLAMRPRKGRVDETV